MQGMQASIDPGRELRCASFEQSSIRQPFVEQILRGIKKYECRSRPSNIRERIYLYASARPLGSVRQWRKVGKLPGQLPTGRIVGSVEVVDCVRRKAICAEFAYVLTNPRRLRRSLIPVNQPQPVFRRPQFMRE